MPRDSWCSIVSRSRDRREPATGGNLPGPGCGRKVWIRCNPVALARRPRASGCNPIDASGFGAQIGMWMRKQCWPCHPMGLQPTDFDRWGRPGSTVLQVSERTAVSPILPALEPAVLRVRWIPACAGMTIMPVHARNLITPAFRRDDGVYCIAISAACAGMTGLYDIGRPTHQFM
jgi:hypothetical protein